MKEIKYVIYREGEHFVSRCLNVDVASFGNTVDEAIKNITEAVELYFEDHDFQVTKKLIECGAALQKEDFYN